MVGGFAFRCVGIIFHFARGVEDHCGALVGDESGPSGDAGVVGVAGACEVNPRFAHLGGEMLRFGSIASHVLAALGVIEAKG